jgi:HSP20 family protein
MAIVRWDPWQELGALERRFDELVGRAMQGGQASRSWAPAIDVHQDGDMMVVRAEIAGVPPEQVDITIDGDVLTISGTRDEDRSVDDGQWIRRERLSGTFQRSIALPPGVDPDEVTAEASNGVIEIHVPRARPASPRKVELHVSDGSGAGSVPVGSTSGEGAESPSGPYDRAPAEGER